MIRNVLVRPELDNSDFSISFVSHYLVVGLECIQFDNLMESDYYLYRIKRTVERLSYQARNG